VHVRGDEVPVPDAQERARARLRLRREPRRSRAPGGNW
jgi:hypothetical protein